MLFWEHRVSDAKLLDNDYMMILSKHDNRCLCSDIMMVQNTQSIDIFLS